MDFFRRETNGLTLFCVVQPNASRDGLAGLHDGRVKVQVSSPPIDGKANERLIKFIAKTFGVAKSRVAVVRGAGSRQKTLFIDGASALPKALTSLLSQETAH
ncbi:MAG: YggU family protein [Porticoccaceae bacterium]|nr:YggU family protein [Porticoccaceae bacterium]